MATEEQKKARQMKLVNDIIFGFAKGMYDLFDDSALATVETIGEDIIEEIEHELGLEIHGENPRDILTELERLLLDEYGMCKNASINIQDHEVDVVIEGCMFWHATMELRNVNIPPYTCVPMMIASAALRKRLGKRARFVGITHDMEKRACDIDFHMLD
jgi:hypothetical protein